MATIDNYNNIYEVLVLPPADYNASQESDSVDTQGFESVDFFIIRGVVGAAGVWTPSLWESDDNVTFTEVVNGVGDDPAHPLLGTPASFDSTTTNLISRLGYVGNKRYVRANIDLAGASTATIAVLAQLAHPHSAPTDAQLDD